MDREILAEIFVLGETANIEFERCGQYPRKDTFETVCSLADTLHEREGMSHGVRLQEGMQGALSAF